MIISKTKGKRILLVHDLCDHNTLDESALDKLSNVLGEHEIEVQTNVPLDRWSAQSNAEWCKVVQHEGKVSYLPVQTIYTNNARRKSL